MDGASWNLRSNGPVHLTLFKFLTNVALDKNELGIVRIVELNIWWGCCSFSEMKHQIFRKWPNILRHRKLVSGSKCLRFRRRNYSGQDSAEGWGSWVWWCVCVCPKLQDFKIPALNVKLQSHKCHVCSLSPKWLAYCGKYRWKPSAVYVLWTLFTEKLLLLIPGDRPKNGTCSWRGLNSSGKSYVAVLLQNCKWVCKQ